MNLVTTAVSLAMVKDVVETRTSNKLYINLFFLNMHCTYSQYDFMQTQARKKQITEEASNKIQNENQGKWETKEAKEQQII